MRDVVLLRVRPEVARGAGELEESFDASGEADEDQFRADFGRCPLDGDEGVQTG